MLVKGLEQCLAYSKCSVNGSCYLYYYSLHLQWMCESTGKFWDFILSRQMTCLCSHGRGIRCEGWNLGVTVWPHEAWPIQGGRWNRSITLCCSVSSGQLPSQLTPWENSQVQSPQSPLPGVFQGPSTLGLSSELPVDVQAGMGLQGPVYSQLTRMEEKPCKAATRSSSLVVHE